MTMWMSRRSCILAPLGAALSGAAMGAPPAFYSVGDLPGGATASQAYGIAPDGSVVVGTSSVGPNQFESISRAFTWRVEESIQPLSTPLAQTVQTVARAVSSQGHTIVGYRWEFDLFQSRPFRWSPSGGMEELPLLAGRTSGTAAGVSADGSVVVGSNVGGAFTLNGEAFRWTPAQGTVGLGFLPGGDWSLANDVSADGSVIVGMSLRNSGQFEACRWVAGGPPEPLGFLLTTGNPSGRWSHARGVSANGQVVVGSSASTQGEQAFRWTAGGGMIGLGAGFGASVAMAASGDGSVIVGEASVSGAPGDMRAMIWESGTGMRDLKTVLESDFGLDLSGWTLNQATDISADGRWLTGNGISPQGHALAWVAFLGSLCAADWDGDGQVNSSDIAAFITTWLTDQINGTTLADVDGSGITNSQDISAFLTAWLAAVQAGGC